MKAIKELEAQIKSSDERVESFERALEIESTARGVLARELEKVKAEQQQWPQEGDSYFTYDSKGMPMETKWGTFPSEGVYLKLGMIFKTKKELLIDKGCREAETEVLRMLREYEGDFEVKFSELAVSCSPAYYSNVSKIKVLSWAIQCAPLSWYSSREAWERVISENPDLVKTMLGVE